MRSAFEWDRFMRFMERYAEDNGACSCGGFFLWRRCVESGAFA
jgi:hypothetical protein